MQKAAHGIGRGTVHADFTVFVKRHKAECRVYRLVDHSNIYSIGFSDGLPHLQARPAQRVHTKAQAGSRNGLHVQDFGQVSNIRAYEVIFFYQRRAERSSQMGQLHAAIAFFKIRIGIFFYQVGNVRFSRAAVRRIIFEAAVTRGVMRRSDDNAVGQGRDAPGIPAQDGVRDGRGRCIHSCGSDAHLHVVGHQHLKGRTKGRLRQGMGIAPQKERPVNAIGLAVVAYGLSDGINMFFIKGLQQRRAAMPGCAKRHPLGRNSGIGIFGKIGADKNRNIFKIFRCRKFSGSGMDYRHDVPPL